MSYYPLALVILLAFAGGWVWRGAWDVWRTPKAKVYGETGRLAAESFKIGAELLPDPPKLRAVE